MGSVVLLKESILKGNPSLDEKEVTRGVLDIESRMPLDQLTDEQTAQIGFQMGQQSAIQQQAARAIKNSEIPTEQIQASERLALAAKNGLKPYNMDDLERRRAESYNAYNNEQARTSGARYSANLLAAAGAGEKGLESSRASWKEYDDRVKYATVDRENANQKALIEQWNAGLTGVEKLSKVMGTEKEDNLRIAKTAAELPKLLQDQNFALSMGDPSSVSSQNARIQVTELLRELGMPEHLIKLHVKPTSTAMELGPLGAAKAQDILEMRNKKAGISNTNATTEGTRTDTAGKQQTQNIVYGATGIAPGSVQANNTSVQTQTPANAPKTVVDVLGPVDPKHYNPNKPGFNNVGNIQNPDGTFKSYKTLNEGIAAIYGDLAIKFDRESWTPRKLIDKWAPYSDPKTGKVLNPGNPQYILNVAKAAGIKPDEPIDYKDKAMMDRIVGMMIKQENNQNRDTFTPAENTTTPPKLKPLEPGMSLNAGPLSIQPNPVVQDKAQKLINDRNAYEAQAKPLMQSIAKLLNRIPYTGKATPIGNALGDADTQDLTNKFIQLQQMLGVPIFDMKTDPKAIISQTPAALLVLMEDYAKQKSREFGAAKGDLGALSSGQTLPEVAMGKTPISSGGKNTSNTVMFKQNSSGLVKPVSDPDTITRLRANKNYTEVK